ncbi:MAG: TetR/AcrR family transcriptional regulator [Flavobacteriales bacterium]
MSSERRTSILATALQLFADEGYHATTTRHVAQAAGVSEGLIFRHFGSKEGLLKAVMTLGEERIHMLYEHLLTEEDARSMIRQAIAIPFEVPTSQYPFWRLLYKLKWELNIGPDEKMKPLEQALTRAFERLAIPYPEREAIHLVRTMDAIGGEILRGVLTDLEAEKEWLMVRYGV